MDKPAEAGDNLINLNRNKTMQITDDMNLDSAVPKISKYISKEDVDPQILVTISHLSREDIENNGVTEQHTILNFHGDTKPLVLKFTNKELLKLATGETTAGGIKNKQVVLYNDPTIMFGTKMTGGVRIRAPKNQSPPPDDVDDLPF